ncbi:hypothetical protein EVAR_57291_1 [Eumeta japonica]|uniref:Uncharacterized protein n=1 Tax=Eumeta variegata TaxID=151549 RepID=A0A4C1YKP3_EUMVA|nr:hypothetical protein EVAR_57291_1 [Eumeta japonica]
MSHETAPPVQCDGWTCGPSTLTFVTFTNQHHYRETSTGERHLPFLRRKLIPHGMPFDEGLNKERVGRRRKLQSGLFSHVTPPADKSLLPQSESRFVTQFPTKLIVSRHRHVRPSGSCRPGDAERCLPFDLLPKIDLSFDIVLFFMATGRRSSCTTRRQKYTHRTRLQDFFSDRHSFCSFCRSYFRAPKIGSTPQHHLQRRGPRGRITRACTHGRLSSITARGRADSRM